MSNRFITWFFNLSRWKKHIIIVAFDLIAVPTSLFFAYLIRFENFDFLGTPDPYIAVIIATASIVFGTALTGLYKTSTRYISIEAALRIIVVCVASSATLLLSALLTDLFMPRSLPFIFGLIFCSVAIGVRFFVRMVGRDLQRKNQKNIAIFGVGDAGMQIMSMFKMTPEYAVRLFIDDNPHVHGETIAGIPVKNLQKLGRFLSILNIDIIIISTQTTTAEMRQELINFLPKYPVEIKKIPRISDLLSEKYDVSELADINIADLLGREPVEPDKRLMQKTLNNKTILVTGAGGSIGSELCRQIVNWNPERIILLDVSEFAIYSITAALREQSTEQPIDIVPVVGSVLDNHFLLRIFKKFKIDTIYHAAAYKHVSLMELNVLQCVTNNVFGTLNVINHSISSNVKNFILVSTDKAVNPTNVMGASKRFAEVISQTLLTGKKNTCYSIVRFGNVLGSSGSVVPLFKKQIETGGPVTLTHLDVTRYFMTIPEAAQLVIQAGALSHGREVFVLDMGKPVKILDLAKRMISLAGYQPLVNENRSANNNEISIEICGLQTGEKLHEELAYDEKLLSTVHPRIWKSIEEPISAKKVRELVTKLRDAVEKDDHEKVYKVLAAITGGKFNTPTPIDVS